MRVLLSIDGCYQLYDTFRIISGDNFNMIVQLDVNNHIIVEDVRDTLRCFRQLMAYGYIDLSDCRSYYWQSPIQYTESESDDYGNARELEPSIEEREQ